MRNLFFLLIFLLLSCQKPDATFIVTAKNFPPNVVISVNDWETGSALAIENVTSKFTFKVYAPKERYARLLISGPNIQRRYWIYIAPGEQTINLNIKQNKYPVHATTEKGKELMQYYEVKERLSKVIGDSAEMAGLKLEQATPFNVEERLANSKMWDERLANLQLDIVRDLAKKHPSSMLTLILLTDLGGMDQDPQAYKKVIDMTSDEVKESKEGVAFLKELDGVLKVSVGAVMPDITGQTPRGEGFNAAKVLKKINVVICWMSYNNMIRRNHATMVALYKKYRANDVEFIGVSLDKKRKYWTDVIKADGLIWPQYADMLGAKSPNAKLSNMSIPYVFIIDKNKKILSQDVQPERLDFEIKTELERLK